MPKTTEPNEYTTSTLGAVPSTLPEEASNPERRWARPRVIWTLLVLSLLPGVIASQFREYWHQQLPATARIAAYVASGLFIAVACGLMLKMPGDISASKEERSSGLPGRT